MVDQVLTYILSGLGIIGFLLAGKKVWWAWYVNIANQFIWLVFSIITQQWGFLLATLFYFVVFSKNAYHWTREHFASPTTMDPSKNPKPPVEGPVGPAGDSSGGREMAQQPVHNRFNPRIRSADDIPEPPASSRDSRDTEAMHRFMNHAGANPEVSNQIAFVVMDVIRAYYGKEGYVPFSVRYGIAQEVQRRLDVVLKGMRPDEQAVIRLAIETIDFATKSPLAGTEEGSREVMMARALGMSRRTFVELLRTVGNAKKA